MRGGLQAPVALLAVASLLVSAASNAQIPLQPPTEPVTSPQKGVITGRIVDEFGDPVVEASVQVHRAVYTQGWRRLVGTASTKTDDRGVLRIRPGDCRFSK